MWMCVSVRVNVAIFSCCHSCNTGYTWKSSTSLKHLKHYEDVLDIFISSSKLDATSTNFFLVDQCF